MKGGSLQVVLEVRFYATLRKYAPQGSAGVMMVHMPDGVTAEELLSELNVDLEEVKIIMVNGVSHQPGLHLSDGDRIGVFPAVGGG